MKLARFFFLLAGSMAALGQGCAQSGTPEPAIDYRQEMRTFVEALSAYAKQIHPGFIVIAQNGAELVSATGETEGPPDRDYLNAIDGIGQESLFYGFSRDGEKTPPKERAWTAAFLDMARTSNVTILATDYCRTRVCMREAIGKNREKGYIAFAAEHRELDNIPGYPGTPVGENDRTIRKLAEAGNFLYLINPKAFPSRQALVEAIGATNYDLVILDFFFRGEAFTPQQIRQLKRKSNGGSRLLIAYMSIGEAEDYRYYWQPSWGADPPEWLAEENPRWEGNFLVEYWNPEWQRIIYGSDDSYLGRIVNAGFDGVYLDIIDAFEYFEAKAQRD